MSDFSFQRPTGWRIPITTQGDEVRRQRATGQTQRGARNTEYE